MPERIYGVGEMTEAVGGEPVISRLRLAVKGIRINLVRGWQETSGLRSFLQWVLDIFLYRIMAVIPIAGERLRTIRLEGGVALSYRRTRSDFRTVAETWMTRVYDLPFAIDPPRLIVDLGANIGSTSTWLALRYGCQRLIAVEPIPENATLARLNLAANGIAAEVHEAAVGATEGTAYFDDSGDSMEGHLADHGREVRVTTVPSLIGSEQVDLMKIDIEGAEGEVIGQDPTWLSQVRLVVAELHPHLADTDDVVRTMDAAGFECQRLPGDPDSVSGPAYLAVFRRPESG
jgi:FkbM family methyltransferase